MTAWILGAGLVVVCAIVLGLAAYGLWLKDTLQRQRQAILANDPNALVNGAQSALVTNLALARIGRAKHASYPRSGPVFSIAVSSGSLRLFRGKRAEPFAVFKASEVADYRVGTTTLGLADFTTIFIGISAGNSTFELPIRLMGSRPTSIMTASRRWADEYADAMFRALKSG